MKPFENVRIAGLTHVDGPIRVESEMLEAGFEASLKRLGSRVGLLRSLTGVQARRFFEPQITPSQIATMAARALLEQAPVDPQHVGVLINTSVSKDFIEPSVASAVHGQLGLSSECLNFDLGNACLAFLNGMDVAAAMIERGHVEHALVVAGESSRYAVEQTVNRLASSTATEAELKENFATLTLGSGGAAMLLSHARTGLSQRRYIGGVSLAATQHNHLCRAQPHQMQTDSAALLQAGVELAKSTFDRATRVLDWTPENLDVLVMHQVGSVHFRTLLSQMGLDLDRAPVTYDEFGNMGPASIPITLSKALESGSVNDGDRVALMGIGSGLNCAMMEVQW